MAIINPNGSLPVDILSGAGSIDIDAWQYEKTSSINALVPYLFRNNEVGFAYDPNDLTTLYQDAAGTIPVTAAGQPVGLMLDKSGRGNHARQTTSASRPILRRNATTGAYYLEFDGTDDFLVTNTIDFTATDKLSLFAGVRKLSDAAFSVFAELSTTAAANAGTFAIYTPNAISGVYGFRSTGSLVSTAIEATPMYPSPSSNIISSFGGISTDTATLRLNGVQRASSSTDQGTGNYGNYPLYIGRRGGTTSPFNGHIYSLIGIGRLTTDSETIALEKSIAKNTGVTL